MRSVILHKKFCKNRQLRPTALYTYFNFQQCFQTEFCLIRPIFQEITFARLNKFTVFFVIRDIFISFIKLQFIIIIIILINKKQLKSCYHYIFTHLVHLLKKNYVHLFYRIILPLFITCVNDEQCSNSKVQFKKI